MRVPLCLLLAAVYTLATETNEDEARGSKRPYVADALGNALPPPSKVPATVGSPVNLLTPDRYEFYTFDESGELVKRLMTLEEIQAIVAAGEEAEGLVTFANDNQPTIAFNFSQPPYTKVHNVVTNVQNVLKAQLEAHKNKPHFQPTLDTPDVSDSWSLILPSIFGNTGVDIVPDKIQNTGTFTTPETETIDLDLQDTDVEDNTLSKESSNSIISSSTTMLDEEVKAVPVTEKLLTSVTDIKVEPSTTRTTTTTPEPTTITTTTTRKPTTKTESTSTTKRPTTTSRARPTIISTTTTTTTTTPKVTTTSTRKPSITTTIRPSTTTSTTVKPRITTSTTAKPRTTTSTTIKPRITTTTLKPTTTTKIVRATPAITTTIKPDLITEKDYDDKFTKIQPINISIQQSTTPIMVQYEKNTTFIPISTVSYVTERTTQRPVHSTKSEELFASTTKQSVITTMESLSSATITPSTVNGFNPITNNLIRPSTTPRPDYEPENGKLNATTITTQSISPSTTVSSTEFLSKDNLPSNQLTDNILPTENNDENAPMIPLFDVAQSISQIASDLGSNYRPIPTTSNILDTTKFNGIDLESKENLELDIPTDKPTEITPVLNITDSNGDNFVKISTLDPHPQNETINIDETTQAEVNDTNKSKISTKTEELTTATLEGTTIDPFLSESMGDLLSQVVNQQSQTIVTSEKIWNDDDKITTTEIKLEIMTTENPTITTTATSIIPLEIANGAHPQDVTQNLPNIKNRISDTNTSGDVVQNIPVYNQSSVNSSTDSTIKDNNNEKNENYVQISISHDKMELSSVAPIFKSSTEGDVIKTDTDNHLNKQSLITNNSYSNFEKSTTSMLTNVDVTTKPSIFAEVTESVAFTQPIKNKYIIADNNNKFSNKNNKIKLPELLPKIDDFKKKIQKVNIDDKELAAERNNSWKLISTVSPPKANEIPKDKLKNDAHHSSNINGNKDIVLDFSKENQGLEVTTKDLSEDIAQFTELCNELAFRYWNTIIENIDKRRSFVLSPYSITSMLAMMFMGARGATSGEMNEILKLDDMVTFNPHFTLKNISDSIETSPEAGVIVSAFIRELYSDRNKGKILRFYKERAQQFYNGHVEEIDFKMIGDKIRRRTNLLVKRYTWGKILEYIKTDKINMQPPLAAFSANIFETDCSGSSVEGRDGEMYFVVSPNVRQRRLVPVPAVVYRSGFLAGYDPVLDATAAALGNTNTVVSTLLLMPGQQGNVVHSEDLEALEQRLLDSNPSTPTWNRLLRTLLPRIGLELQIPRFSHKSVFNISSTLRRMGLKDLFDAEHADLGGLNGPSKDLYLSDMIQSTTFVTCGEGVVGDQHHVEVYPESVDVAQRRRTSRWASDWDEPRDYQRAFHDPHDVGEAMHLPLHLRPRQARLPARNAQPARLRFDRPFLYFVRHNPSGMILYVGRYNPRLLP